MKLKSFQSMKGKSCLITGATSGIGQAAARELAHLGAKVILVGRSPQKCTETVESIRKESPYAQIDFLVADLSSQDQIHRLAKEFLNRHDRLDVLINNAGALFALRQESVDGIEMTMALNHLAYFQLTILLLDCLKQTAPARIINVSSRAHTDLKEFDADDPQAKIGPRAKSYGKSELSSLFYCLVFPWKHPGFVQYAHSKLANLLFTFELAKRLKSSGITVNAVHPGFVATHFSSGNGALGMFMGFWSRIFGKSPEEGAMTLVYLASSPEVEGITGKYFANQKMIPSSPASLDPMAGQRLWNISVDWTGVGRN